MKSLKISTINKKAEVSGEEIISGKILEKEVSPLLVSQAVNAFLANQRRSFAKTKTRAVVVGSKSKIYRQKGTGRARHGDRQAPIFVGGGVAHGPSGEQNYKKALPRKMTQRAILKVLTDKITEKKAYLVEGLNFKKTKEASLFIDKLKENLKEEGKIALIIGNEADLKKSFRNLAEAVVLSIKSISPYELLSFDCLLITQEAFEEMKKYFGLEAKEEKNEKAH
ncbi:50S ribosomal protein L4 [Candidatus Microgenomates bacterium]|jgi:large subunit ribosomal protein L4|nr:MAG: 50S ribosomal protein L4 [Candidatus Microgenomates bacterium]